jgi:hypothetical protein
MQVKTNVKAGADGTGCGSQCNHNEARVRAAARGLKVQTGVKAGTPVRGTINVRK